MISHAHKNSNVQHQLAVTGDAVARFHLFGMILLSFAVLASATSAGYFGTRYLSRGRAAASKTHPSTKKEHEGRWRQRPGSLVACHR
jgi:hypothetical protein